MLSNWVIAGERYESIWTLTLREVDLVLRAHERRVECQWQLAYFTGWQSGYHSQPFQKGKYPPYDPHKFVPRTQQKQSLQHQIALARRWDNAMNRKR